MFLFKSMIPRKDFVALRYGGVYDIFCMCGISMLIVFSIDMICWSCSIVMI